MRISNALTVDVEDYYMVSGFSDRVRFDDWHGFESRVEQSTNRVLELFSRHGVKGTFFILGWIAERHPGLVRDIHSAGHEIACHGYNHRLVYDITPDDFRMDVRRAKDILEGITGAKVNGYRAASYSVVKETLWALDILMEEGFLYDSSIFPIRHDRYGIPGAGRFAHYIETKAGRLLEFPPSTVKLLGQNLPVAGGGYFRLLPLWLTSMALRRINISERMPAVFYIHPWEIDEGQPRLKVGAFAAMRHYANIGRTMKKLERLLREFSFRPLASFMNESAQYNK